MVPPVDELCARKTTEMSNILPLAPVFIWDRSAKWISLEKIIQTTRRVPRRRVAAPHEFIGYDANMTKWTMTYDNPDVTKSIWTGLLARIHNPWTDATVLWIESGGYMFEELRDLFLKAVEHDLTQFVEGDELKDRLNKANTFQELVDVWEWLWEDSTYTSGRK